MSGNPFESGGDQERKSAGILMKSDKKLNPFEAADEEVTVSFEVPNGPNAVRRTRPPPRPPKPVAAPSPSSSTRGTTSQRTPMQRVFGGAMTEGSPSLFTRVSSKVMNSAPSSSVFTGANRYSMVTTDSGPSSPAFMNNPFSDDCETEEKSEIETRSPLRLSANSSSNASSTRTKATISCSSKDDKEQRNSEEICNDTGIELMESGRTQRTPPSKPTKVPTKGPTKPAKPDKPAKKKVKKIRKKITAVDKNDENAVVRHLLSDLVYGYPHTYGGRCSNYRYYVQYNHPLLSIYFTHPLHPFTRRQRFIVFLCSLSFAVCFAFILLNTPLVPVFATCRSVCNCQVVTDDDPRQPHNDDAPFSECVGGYNDGRACSTYNDICGNYQSWMLSALCGAATVVYDSLLRFLATCSCIHGRKRFQNNCCGQRVKALIEFFGSVTLLVFAVLSFVFTLLTAVLAYVDDIAAEVFLVLVLSELWSTVQWIVWSTPYFLYKFPSDKRKFYEKLKRRSLKHPELAPPEAIV